MSVSKAFSDSEKQPARGITPTPHLRRRAEFVAALNHYQPSPYTIEVLKKARVVALVAPTATGRNALINYLVQAGDYQFIVSDTTRPPRMNEGVWESNGVEYFFRPEDDVLADIKAGNYVEAELIHAQQISGINAREIARIASAGKVALADIDIEGALNIAHLKPDAIVIFLLPPSFAEWLERIKGRSAFTPIELRRRFETALRQFEVVLNDPRFICIINDDFKETAHTIEVIAAGRSRVAKENARARTLTVELQRNTKAYIDQHLSTLDA